MQDDTMRFDDPPSTPARLTTYLAALSLGCAGLACHSSDAGSTNDVASHSATSERAALTHQAPSSADAKPASSDEASAEPPSLADANAPSAPTPAALDLTTTRARAVAPPQDRYGRVYARTRNIWIRGRPTNDTQWIGFLWWGDSVALREPEPVEGPGCSSWYAVEPLGYVCVDGERATLDGDDPLLQAIQPYAHDRTRPNPHPHYGESTDARRYLTLPSTQTQRAREWDYRFRMGWIETARNGGPIHEQLQGVDLNPAPAVTIQLPSLPSTLQMSHRRLIARSSVAWTREVLHEGRSWLLTDDLTWVAKDRVKPYPRVDFKGVHLGDVQLPIAFFRGRDGRQYQLNDEDELVETGDTYRRLSWVSLTGEERRSGRTTFYETRDGYWVSSKDTAVPRVRKETPWGAPVYGVDETGKAPRGRQTWIETSIWGGWLIAYEGTRPVFTTLMSPGRGGPPQGDIDPVETASTPTGRFVITGKFVTSTMIAPNDLVHSAVPWAQNFSGPHAIHGAYWHNSWGELKSGGCVNLSPIDAKWLFEFTEPELPEGWHGVRWLPKEGPATRLIIRRN